MNAQLESVVADELASVDTYTFPLLEYHELANLFSRMSDEQFELLIDDVRRKGLLEPIVLYENKILDGRHRYEACRRASVEPRFVRYIGNDPLESVKSLNVHRRHLDEVQAAAAVAYQQDWTKAARHGGSRKESANGMTSADRARQARVSPTTQKKVDAIGRKKPELLGKLVRGELTLSEAREAAGLKGRATECTCEPCTEYAAKVRELKSLRPQCASRAG
jgi:hypothetical protein